MSLLDVVDRIANQDLQPFIAPIPEARRVRVTTIQDGIPYRFWFAGREPGWWLLRPDGERARVVEEAQPHDYLSYLDLLPRFYAIALFRASPHTWVVTPYNASDAAQRGWRNGEPRQAHLVRHSVRPMDVVTLRSLGGTMLYDGIAPLPEGVSIEIWRRDGIADEDLPAHFLQPARIIAERERAIREEMARQTEEAERQAFLAELAERRNTVEGRLRHDLEFSGATLRGWEEVGENYIVHWEHGGNRYEMRVSRDMRIDSAGVCLAGTDRQHNLSSIVAVMEGSVESDGGW